VDFCKDTEPGRINSRLDRRPDKEDIILFPAVFYADCKSDVPGKRLGYGKDAVGARSYFARNLACEENAAAAEVMKNDGNEDIVYFHFQVYVALIDRGDRMSWFSPKGRRTWI